MKKDLELKKELEDMGIDTSKVDTHRLFNYIKKFSLHGKGNEFKTSYAIINKKSDFKKRLKMIAIVAGLSFVGTTAVESKVYPIVQEIQECNDFNDINSDLVNKFKNDYMHGGLGQYTNIYEYNENTREYNYDYDYQEIEKNITRFVNDYEKNGFINEQDALNFAFYEIHAMKSTDFNANDIINHYLSGYEGNTQLDYETDFEHYNQYLNDLGFSCADDFYDYVREKMLVYSMFTEDNQSNENSFNDFMSAKGGK